MKVILSGGWGYGNLGDDAILIASIKLINNHWSNAEIVVMSYDPYTTKHFLDNNTIEYESVTESMHRVLFEDSAYKFLGVYKKTKNWFNVPKFIRRITNAIKRRIVREYDWKKYYNKNIKSEKFKQIETIFQEADIFIMSGGGYFNNWNESFIARIEELKCAKRGNAQIILVGQTLDKFTDSRGEQIQEMFKQIKISLRDEYSVNELARWGIKSELCPDLALSLYEPDTECYKTSRIAVILAELPIQKKDIIERSLIKNLKKKNSEVVVLITRRYNEDVELAVSFHKKLKQNGLESNLCIANNLNDITDSLKGCNIVISRNLHGLILGYVCGVANLICLHDGWKFKAFMKQINRYNCIIDMSNSIDVQMDELFAMCEEELIDKAQRIALKNEVVMGFNKLLQ